LFTTYRIKKKKQAVLRQFVFDDVEDTASLCRRLRTIRLSFTIDRET